MGTGLFPYGKSVEIAGVEVGLDVDGLDVGYVLARKAFGPVDDSQ